MKELSIEEKAKRYDEAIEIAKEINNEQRAQPFNVMTRVFPELAESEDERIRKELIEFVKSRGGFKQEYIAWLEKQGDLTIRFFTDEFEFALGRIIAFWNQNHKDGKYDENELMSYIKVRETELVKLFTDNVCKVSLSDCSEEYRKAYYDGYNKCNRDWLKIKDKSVDEYNKNAEILLGGQGEQKSADKAEPKFKVGDTVTVKPMSCHGKVFKGEPFKIVDIIEDNYVSDDGKAYSISLQDGWELVEQKPAWSEEDKKMARFVGNAITADDASTYLKDKGIEVIDAHVWLDELKDRVQPQSQWKPSEGQIRALNYYLRDHIDNDGVFGSQLVKLYHDLLKLRKE